MNPRTVFLSLGSNVGERENHLRAALAGLEELLSLQRVSSLYETEPLYVTEQPRFLNLVAAGACALAPADLLGAIHQLEARLGRRREGAVPKGPRVIDIDILLYGNLVVDSPGLQIPHPRLRERQFALVPLLEIEPEARDPRDGRPYAQVSRELGPQGVYMRGPCAYTRGSGPT